MHGYVIGCWFAVGANEVEVVLRMVLSGTLQTNARITTTSISVLQKARHGKYS